MVNSTNFPSWHGTIIVFVRKNGTIKLTFKEHSKARGLEY